MSATIFLEGGGPRSELRTRCQKGFHKLLEKCGFTGRMPKLVACGARGASFDRFKIAHKAKRKDDFIAMLIDSEDPVADIEKPWKHLQQRDGWKKPKGASDDQVLFMTTCMETWIVSDPAALQAHYGTELQESALPPLVKLETQLRHRIQGDLIHATRNCTNAYGKGKRSFEVLAELNPATLEEHLPSFARALRILRARL